jgi:cytochrome d ubiquinol oxidase subunit II
MMADAALPIIWAALIAFAVLAYVVLDGFDLGIGILFAVERKYQARSVLVTSVAPVWDGNETWLVLGGGGLLAVFPMAYGLILPALYPTITAMLLALIFRGVAFEFRFRARSVAGQALWDFAFFAGSTVAAFAQGLTLGGLMQGVRHNGPAYAGGWWDWLSPFTLLCGVAVVLGYALLGACWLIWRTDDILQERARGYARVLGPVVLAFTVIVSLWSPFLHPQFWHRWFGWPWILLSSPVPILLAALATMFRRGLDERHHVTPFLCVIGWFALCFAGLGISFWPLMVPPDVTVWQASAPPGSQRFLLAGAIFLVPMVLAYTIYSYWVFRGKVDAETHYH